jgi:hypothetical protein
VWAGGLWIVEGGVGGEKDVKVVWTGVESDMVDSR